MAIGLELFEERHNTRHRRALVGRGGIVEVFYFIVEPLELRRRKAPGAHHPLNELGQAVADERGDRGQVERRNPLAREHLVGGNHYVWRAIDKRAVEIEDDTHGAILST